MQPLILAMILLMGPDHQVVGGLILPGASTDLAACQKKTAAYLEQLTALPPNTIAIGACAALAPATGT